MQYELLGIRFIIKAYEFMNRFLDMVMNDCNLDLIKGLVAKVIEVFHCLELQQVYTKS